MSGTMAPKDREEKVSSEIVSALADVTETKPENLCPLYNSIDPDALDKLFRNRPHGTVIFNHIGYEITIDSHGGIQINDPDGE